MTAAEERIARLLAAHLRALEWCASFDDEGRAVVVSHPTLRREIARVSVEDGRLELVDCERVYGAGIAAAIEHVRGRAGAVAHHGRGVAR